MHLAGTSKKTAIIISILLLLLLALISGVIIYLTNIPKTLSDSINSQDDISKTLEDIAKVALLPEGESPTIASVTEGQRLKEQDYFKDSMSGDKILIYPNAKKAILYRPSLGKVVETVMISASTTDPNTSTPSGSTTTQASKTYDVSIFNGTQTKGLASKTETDLNSKFKDQINVMELDNAEGDHNKTIIVSLNSEAKSLAEEIAKHLKGEVSTLPSGETKPSSDIAIYLGD